MMLFLARRLTSAFLVLVLVSALSFGIIWLVPGDPTAVLLDAARRPNRSSGCGAARPGQAAAAADDRMVRADLRGDLDSRSFSAAALRPPSWSGCR